MSRFFVVFVLLAGSSCTLFRAGFLSETDPDPYPEDGVYDAALEIGINEEVADKVGPYNTDPDDWKRFRVAEEGRYAVRVKRTQNEQPLVVRVYTEGSKLKGSMLCFEKSSQAIVDTFKAGNYLIEVVAEGETVIPYILVVEPASEES